MKAAQPFKTVIRDPKSKTDFVVLVEPVINPNSESKVARVWNVTMAFTIAIPEMAGEDPMTLAYVMSQRVAMARRKLASVMKKGMGALRGPDVIDLFNPHEEPAQQEEAADVRAQD